jgi:cell division ATPase FtsA
MECLNIPFVLAEKLKDEIKLNFEIEEDDKYKVTVNDESCEVSAATANEIARARIEYIGEMIKKCFKQCSFEVPSHLPLYITGGGLSLIRGAAEILSVSLDRNVEIISPQLAQLGKPYLSSSAGLLDFCLGIEEKEKKGFFSRLFG